MSYSATHVYAVVRVKVIGTESAGDAPETISSQIAEAVAADPDAWMIPVRGRVNAAGKHFDVADVEFAANVTQTLVDEIDPETNSVVKEHWFDYTGAAELQKKMQEACELVSRLHSALDDAATGMEDGDASASYASLLGEAHAFLRSNRQPPTPSAQPEP